MQGRPGLTPTCKYVIYVFNILIVYVALCTEKYMQYKNTVYSLFVSTIILSLYTPNPIISYILNGVSGEAWQRCGALFLAKCPSLHIFLSLVCGSSPCFYAEKEIKKYL